MSLFKINWNPTWLRASYRLAIASLLALIALSLAWELRLAPLRPGGSWLALKALLLCLPLAGIVLGRRYTYQWSSMFILLYFTEGVMRAWGARHGNPWEFWLALAEVALSMLFYGAVVVYARLGRQGG